GRKTAPVVADIELNGSVSYLEPHAHRPRAGVPDRVANDLTQEGAQGVSGIRGEHYVTVLAPILPIEPDFRRRKPLQRLHLQIGEQFLDALAASRGIVDDIAQVG